MKKSTLDKLVRRVQTNMMARAAGITAEYVRQTIADVLDGLSCERWKAQSEADVCEAEFEELCDDAAEG